MSWASYNDIIEAIMEAEGLELEDAREHYRELRDDGYSVDDIRDQYDVTDEGMDNYYEWVDHYDSGDYDDDPYEEIDGGIDYPET